MIGDKTDIANARAQADAARARLLRTIGEIQARLNPRTLAKEAWEEVREHGSEMAAEALRGVKEKPGRTAVIAGAIGLFLARKPIVQGVTSLLRRDDNETDGAEDGSAED